MKTIMLWLVLCIGTGAIYAQTIGEPVKNPKKDYYQKGELMLGLGTNQGIGFGRVMENGEFVTRLGHLQTGLSVGKFVANKFLVGTRAAYRYSRLFGGNGSEHQVSTSLFARYYFTQSTFAPFVESGFGINQIIQTESFQSHSAQSFMENRIGLAYRPGKKMSLEGSFGLRSQFIQNIGTRHNYQFKLGVNFHF